MTSIVGSSAGRVRTVPRWAMTPDVEVTQEKDCLGPDAGGPSDEVLPSGEHTYEVHLPHPPSRVDRLPSRELPLDYWRRETALYGRRTVVGTGHPGICGVDCPHSTKEVPSHHPSRHANIPRSGSAVVNADIELRAFHAVRVQ